MLLRRAVNQQPQDHANESQATRADEGRFPAPRAQQASDNRVGDDRSDICPGVENAGRQGSFFFGEPFRYAFDRGGGISPLSPAPPEAGGQRRTTSNAAP